MRESLTRWFGLVEKNQDFVQEIPVDQISPSPFQPRTVFKEDAIDELCQTIRVHGVIQPIIVRRKESGFELIAGERRWRAVKKLQLPTIPAIVREMSDRQAASAALIENLQREGLTAIEEAVAYQKLLELYGITQESLAQRLGKGQSTIANKLRLLQLPKAVQVELMKRTITERHARALLALKDEELQLKMMQEIIEKDLNVKQTEERIRKWLTENKGIKKKAKMRSVSRDVRLALNTIRESIKMVKQTGITVEMDEEEKEGFIEVLIRIPK